MLSRWYVCLLCRSQREVWAKIEHIDTSREPYLYKLQSLDDKLINYVFTASNLKPAPDKEKLKLTVNHILQTDKDGRLYVNVYGYPR